MITLTITDWNEYKNLVSSPKMQSWIFRGQSDASWPVLSSISRHFENFNLNKKAWPHLEERLLRIFKRKAHHYLDYIPKDHEAFEWLSIIQHHGTPTRLVDFTFSP